MGARVGALSSPIPTRLGKSTGFSPSRAAFMKSSHIDNGGPLLATSAAPPILVSGSSTPLTSLNIATAVDSCGVKPANHTDLRSSEVPVLPADGRPRPLAREAVPPVLVTVSIASMVSAATSFEKASTTWGAMV